MATAEYSLTSLDLVKYFMGMTGTDSESDDLLENLIDRVSTLFESYCDRNILSREYNEVYDGRGSNKLYTNQYPITSVSGIWDDYDWTWDSGTEVDSDYYRIYEGGRYITFRDTYLYDYQQNVKIIYTAGYATVPSDIQHACITEVARSYKNKNQVDITSKTLADGSVSYSAKSFLPLTLTTLNVYKRISIC